MTPGRGLYGYALSDDRARLAISVSVRQPHPSGAGTKCAGRYLTGETFPATSAGENQAAARTEALNRTDAPVDTAGMEPISDRIAARIAGLLS